MAGSRWLEVLVITAAAPVVGSLVAPGDAYLLRAPFPWLVLAPLLVALQHGLWAGLVSAALLSGGALWYLLALGAVPAATLASWSLGCVLVAIIAGQLRDSARTRSQNLEQRSAELQDRLERSERTRHLIELSHAKLVERVVTSRSSLVAAIEGAQRRMSDARSMHELGQVLLDALASQGNLHAASAYIAGREQASLVTQPVASFGGSGASSARHPLVVRAFQTGKLAAIVDAGDADPRDRSVLVAVPLITSARKVVGVVAVHQMPFMAFQTEHLQQLFVLAGHLADMLFDRWSALHETPLAIVPAELPAATPPPVHATPVAHEPTQRTWRGMPAVRVVEAGGHEDAHAHGYEDESAPEDLAASSRPVATPTDEFVVSSATTQPDTAEAEKLVMESEATSVTVDPAAAPQSNVAETDNQVATSAATAATIDVASAAAAPAEDPVSETVPISSPRAPNRASTPAAAPAPDPNRIAALIRGAVRAAPKAKVNGVAIGTVKPTPAGSALRERVRAVAQTRSGSSH